MSSEMEIGTLLQKQLQDFKSLEQLGQITQESEVDEKQPPLTNTTNPKQQWNQPRINLYRYLASLLGLFLMGMNDAAYGALIPYVRIPQRDLAIYTYI